MGNTEVIRQNPLPWSNHRITKLVFRSLPFVRLELELQ
jgi:hypothetical protein